MKKILRKVLPLLLPIVILIITIVFGNLLLKDNRYMNEFGLYNRPSCFNDWVAFTSDTCEKCGANIMKDGVLWRNDSVQGKYNLDKSTVLRFSDCYDSYEEFKHDYDNAMKVVYAVFAVIIAVILSYVILITLHLVKKKAKKNSEVKLLTSSEENV